MLSSCDMGFQLGLVCLTGGYAHNFSLPNANDGYFGESVSPELLSVLFWFLLTVCRILLDVIRSVRK